MDEIRIDTPAAEAPAAEPAMSVASPPPADEPKWFVYVGTSQVGPMTLDELRLRIADDVCSEADFAWTEGMPKWARLAQIPAVSEVLFKKETDALERDQEPESGSDSGLGSDSGAEPSVFASAEPARASVDPEIQALPHFSRPESLTDLPSETSDEIAIESTASAPAMSGRPAFFARGNRKAIAALAAAVIAFSGAWTLRSAFHANAPAPQVVEPPKQGPVSAREKEPAENLDKKALSRLIATNEGKASAPLSTLAPLPALAQITRFEDSLSGQRARLETEFLRITRSLPYPAARKRWALFEKSWMRKRGQLNQSRGMLSSKLKEHGLLGAVQSSTRLLDLEYHLEAKYFSVGAARHRLIPEINRVHRELSKSFEAMKAKSRKIL